MKHTPLALALLCFAQAAMAQSPTDLGHSIGNAATGKVGSKAGFSSSVSQPLTSSNTPMQTVDGTSSFPAQMSCPSTSNYLRITALPTGGAANETSVLVEQDTALTGSYDYSYAVPRLSGVCGNGYLVCDPGTWANCSGYTWGTDGNGHITATVAPAASLGGCQCTNASCGTNLALTNMAIILNTLGGGVTGAVSAANPQYAISKAALTATQISYYGQKSGSCNGATTGGTNPAAFYSNPSSMTSAASALATTQATDSQSITTMQTNLLAAKGGKLTNNTCAINRQFSVQTQTQTSIISGSGQSFCVVQELYGTVVPDATPPTRLDVMISGTAYSGYSGCPSSPFNGGSLTAAAIALQLPANAVSGVSFTTTTLSVNFTPAGTACTPDTAPNLTTGSPKLFAMCSQGFNYGTVGWNANIQYAFDVSTESVQDLCQPYETDPTCRLRDETDYDVTILTNASAAGVITYQNYNPTGLASLPTTQKVTTTLGTYTSTKPWWRVTRVYSCAATGNYNGASTAALKRQRSVASTLAPSGTNTWGFSDLQCDPTGANCQVKPSTVLLPNQNTVQTNCAPGCKVAAAAQNSPATTTTTATQYVTGTTRTQTTYRACDASGACPYDPAKGESVIPGPNGASCWCMNDLPKAAAAIQAITDAAKGLICSSKK